jgi:hypothetical protein
VDRAAKTNRHAEMRATVFSRTDGSSFNFPPSR